MKKQGGRSSSKSTGGGRTRKEGTRGAARSTGSGKASSGTSKSSPSRPARKPAGTAGASKDAPKRFTKPAAGDSPFKKRAERTGKNAQKKAGRVAAKRTTSDEKPLAGKERGAHSPRFGKRPYEKKAPKAAPAVKKDDDGSIRLNKYISNAGICSRREADTFIASGVVTVNGKVITELGYKIQPGDRVMFGERPVRGEKPVYILMNKPKDYITTSKDPQNRKTVMELISVVPERVFPVGRLDRNTTGLLLLTNDGDLAEKLTHPRRGVVKIYHAELDKKFSANDMQKITDGVELEDGFFQPDEVAFVEGSDRKHIGVRIHSGKNRIVRRLFEHLGYEVVKLDRVVYAGLTKKGIVRGHWRHLLPEELTALKML